MNYAWEAALAADRAGLAREAVRYVPARDGSPYTEIVQETINSRDIEQNEVRLNPLYRFSREFAALFDINITDYEASRRIFLMRACSISSGLTCARGSPGRSMPCASSLMIC